MQKPTPAIERMKYIREIHMALFDAVFGSPERDLEKAMWIIANDNQRLLGCSTCTFMFQGKWYPITTGPTPSDCNRTLHQSLIEKVDKLVNDLPFKDKVIKSGVYTLIGNVLSRAGHIDDLYEMFPTEVGNLLPRINIEKFNNALPLSKAETLEIRENNATNMAHLKKLLITQMLMAGI